MNFQEAVKTKDEEARKSLITHAAYNYTSLRDRLAAEEKRFEQMKLDAEDLLEDLEMAASAEELNSDEIFALARKARLFDFREKSMIVEGGIITNAIMADKISVGSISANAIRAL